VCGLSQLRERDWVVARLEIYVHNIYCMKQPTANPEDLLLS
jgi:hypothetical protein